MNRAIIWQRGAMGWALYLSSTVSGLSAESVTLHGQAKPTFSLIFTSWFQTFTCADRNDVYGWLLNRRAWGHFSVFKTLYLFCVRWVVSVLFILFHCRQKPAPTDSNKLPITASMEEAKVMSYLGIGSIGREDVFRPTRIFQQKTGHRRWQSRVFLLKFIRYLCKRSPTTWSCVFPVSQACTCPRMPGILNLVKCVYVERWVGI